MEDSTMGDATRPCDQCGQPRPGEGACPHCGAVAAPTWPAGAPSAPGAVDGAPGPTGPSGVPTSTGAAPPPPAPDISGPGVGAPAPRSGNSGCGRAALIVGLVVLVLLALGAVFLFVVFRNVDDVTFDVDDQGNVEFDGANSYGDDPVLDALWDDCDAGDMGACDDLYFQSPFGSEYEEFGDTCGGRREPGGVCDQ